MKSIIKSLTLACSFMIFGTGFCQVKQSADIQEPVSQENNLLFDLREPSPYTFANQEFTFSPESDRIHIKKRVDKKEVDYADLRRTTDDGLYIMTSTINDNVSFGRFDSDGNFRTLRYDSTNDTVIEERYILGNLKSKEN